MMLETELVDPSGWSEDELEESIEISSFLVAISPNLRLYTACFEEAGFSNFYELLDSTMESLRELGLLPDDAYRVFNALKVLKLTPLIDWDHFRVSTWLSKNFHLTLDSPLNGKQLLKAMESVRELVHLGFTSMESRLELDARIGALECKGAMGGIYDSHFLNQSSALFDAHMGVENMAQMLYALVRFVKPERVLEVGAGYTSLFILQALHDNAIELSKVDSGFSYSSPKLICLDDMSHSHTTAGDLVRIAQQRGLDEILDLQAMDAWDYIVEEHRLDLVWLDFGLGSRVSEFIHRVWDRVPEGGHVMVHSTLTNSLTREWVESLRSNKDSLATEAEIVSFLEPHKTMQNSFTLLRKKCTEPIFSKYP